jgi:hypothetical protein
MSLQFDYSSSQVCCSSQPQGTDRQHALACHIDISRAHGSRFEKSLKGVEPLSPPLQYLLSGYSFPSGYITSLNVYDLGLCDGDPYVLSERMRACNGCMAPLP